MNAPRIGSLFSGAGQLDEGVRSVIGGTVAWHAEVEPAACRVLDYRYPGVPNLGDVTSVDWAAVEPVDVITGGSPCQDVSAAGKRAGMRAGTRSGLWASMVDAIDVIRPSLVIWENVRGVLSAEADSSLEPCAGCVGDGDDGPVLRALGRVVGDLAELGYVGRWHGLRAADVGAPHNRFRVFVVAHPADGGHATGSAGGHAAGIAEPTGHHEVLADAAYLGHQRGRPARDGRAGSADRRGRTTADAERGGRDGWAHEPQRRTLGRAAAAGAGEDAHDRCCHRGHRDGDGSQPQHGVAFCDGRHHCTPADADRDALRVEPVTEPGSGRQAVAGHAGPDTAAHAASRGGPDEQKRGDTQGQHERPVAGAGSGDRAGRAAKGVRELGRTAALVEDGGPGRLVQALSPTAPGPAGATKAPAESSTLGGDGNAEHGPAAGQGLSDLRDDLQSEAVQRGHRGQPPVPSTHDVFPGVREQPGSGASRFAPLARATGQAADQMRDVRLNREAACASPGPRRDEQRPGELDDALLKLPSEAALGRGPGRAHGVDFGPYTPAILRWEAVLGRESPAPTEVGPKGGHRLSPRFVEFLMGWPDGWVTDVPGVSRNEALKLCGNGVVPQQAAEAVRRMLTAQAVAA